MILKQLLFVALAATPLIAIAADDVTSAAALILTAPLDYQVVQRQTMGAGVVPVAGVCALPCDKIEMRLEGKDMNGTALPATWITAILDPATKGFKGDLKTPAGGWYTLNVRAMKKRKEVARVTVAHVGVGEVFVCAGQSNSTSCGGIKAKPGQFPLDGRTQPESGLVSSFDGKTWRIAKDPQPGAHDTWDGGSPWPAFGDAMVARFKVPVGVAVTGHGGTNISQWMKAAKAVKGGKDKAGLYAWTLTRMNQLGKNGFRAVLWHQGESDYGMKAQTYADGLGRIIADFRQDAGWEMPWFVAHASFCPGSPVIDTNSRGGQKILWEKGVALEGPDTDKLLGDLRDHGGKGIHFSRKGLKAHGDAWADKVGTWLEQQPQPGK